MAALSGLDRSEFSLKTCLDVLERKASSHKCLEFAANRSDLLVEEVYDEDLDTVYRLYDRTKPSQGVIIKHAQPFVKFLGPEFPLSTGRLENEYKVVTKLDEILPGCVPEMYFYDQENAVVFLEDFGSYTSLSQKMRDRSFTTEDAKNIACQLAKLHKLTHTQILGDRALNILDKQLRYPDVTSLLDQSTFVRPFMKPDQVTNCSDDVKRCLHVLFNESDIMVMAERMRKIFLEKKESLLHGNLHPSSVFLQQGKIKFTNLEFCHCGPCAFDLAVLITGYIFAYYHHMSIHKDHDIHREFAQQMIDACNATVDTYLEHMTCSTGNRQKYIKDLLSEVAGFTGCEIIRRIVGQVHVEELKRSSCSEVDALGAGVRLLQGCQKIESINFLMVVALMLAY